MIWRLFAVVDGYGLVLNAGFLLYLFISMRDGEMITMHEPSVGMLALEIMAALFFCAVGLVRLATIFRERHDD